MRPPLVKLVRTLAGIACVAATAVALTGCGSSATIGDAASDFSPIAGPNIHLLVTSWPQAVDPQADSSTEGMSLDWQAYTGLTTFAHASGNAGLQVIPGLATALPAVSDGGREYTVKLRSGLVFSNGQRVKAADFAYTVQRAIRLHWSGAGVFLEPLIEGAAAYASGAASTISGIVTDDQDRTITIHLTHPYPAFDQILAQPALGLVPRGTPMRVLTLFPPAGVGPYMLINVVPNQTMQLAQNPYWAQMKIPGIPAGHTAINVRLDADVGGAALSVLNNSADLFDPDNVIPSGLLGDIEKLAPNRLHLRNLGATTDYIFMNIDQQPFRSALVRQAVAIGLDRERFAAEAGNGLLQPACTLLPPAITGHISASCSNAGNLAGARALIKDSGQAGAAVTVWSPPTTPSIQWMTQYTTMLNSIGLKAKLRVVNTAWSNYWTKLGSSTAQAQTGYASWSQTFPSPLSFYGTLLDGDSILPANNRNLSHVDDPKINSTVTALGSISPADASAAASRWQMLERYVLGRDYVAVIGYRETPFFMSDRVSNHIDAMSSPIYGWDFSRIQLTPTDSR